MYQIEIFVSSSSPSFPPLNYHRRLYCNSFALHVYSLGGAGHYSRQFSAKLVLYVPMTLCCVPRDKLEDLQEKIQSQDLSSNFHNRILIRFEKNIKYSHNVSRAPIENKIIIITCKSQVNKNNLWIETYGK